MFAFDQKPRAAADSTAAPPRRNERPASRHGPGATWMQLVTSQRMSGPSVQKKAVVGPVDDPLEREADRAADAVMRKPSAEAAAKDGGAPPAASAASGESARGESVDGNVEEALRRGGGAPLADGVRSFMEPRFGADFSHVRVHTDGESAALNGSLGAKAFTFGEHIYYGAGTSPADNALTAHELSHVVQQTGARGAPQATAQNVVQRTPGPPTQQQVDALVAEMNTLIATANWPALRKVEYAKHSAPLVQAAKDRRDKTKNAPDLTGIGAVKNADRFAAAVKVLQGDWSKPGMDTDKRAQALVDAANVELSDAKAFPLKGFKVKKLTSRGLFDPETWKMEFQKDLIEKASPSNDEVADLGNTTLHEARHCEQAFLAARFIGSDPSKYAADVLKEIKMPGDVAIAAVQREKLEKGGSKLSGAEQARADAMHRAYTTDAPASTAVSDAATSAIEELGKKNDEAQKKLAALKAGPTEQSYKDAIAAKDALAKQKAVVEAAYGKYRALPEEKDAHEVGDTAEVAFRAIP